MRISLFMAAAVICGSANLVLADDMTKGWGGGTGVLCTTQANFNKELAMGKVKIIGTGWRELPPLDEEGKKSAAQYAETTKNNRFHAVTDDIRRQVSLLVVMQSRDGTSANIVDVIPVWDRATKRYADANFCIRLEGDSIIGAFRFYHGGPVPIVPPE